MNLKFYQRFFLSLLVFSTFTLAADQDSLAFLKTERRLESLNYEARFYVHKNQGILQLLSRYQDALLKFLNECESESIFREGMETFSYRSRNVDHCTFYELKEINFYNFALPEMKPHVAQLTYEGETCEGYLNTFKMEREITNEERELFYSQEEERYLRDAVCSPFELNPESIDHIAAETIYNFVLLPDGMLMAALEVPGQKEYHLRDDHMIEEKFTHPNHTILAGSPHQPVISAGAFILFKEGKKKLFFISNKSGHFRPYIKSLKFCRKKFEDFHIPASTVIPLPDVEVSKFLLDNFDHVDLPVVLTKTDGEKLFEIACERWNQNFGKLDISRLGRLAQGDFSIISDDFIDGINSIREEATYMRSAYHLFTKSHEAPKVFHRFVKRFGKLKDALKHGLYERAQLESKKFLRLVHENGSDLVLTDPIRFHPKSFTRFIDGMKAKMHLLCREEALPAEEFHELKKSARELGTLFQLMTKKETNHLSLHRAAAKVFFRINSLMAESHDEYVRRVLNGEVDKGSEVIPLSPNIASLIRLYLNHLTLIPPKIHLGLNPKIALALISEAHFSWTMAHFNLITDQKLLPPLVEIIHREPVHSTPQFKGYLQVLKQSAEIFSHCYRLFDIRHATPAKLNRYIDLLDQVISYLPDEAMTVDVPVEGLEPFWDPFYPDKVTSQIKLVDQDELESSYNKLLRSVDEISGTEVMEGARLNKILELSDELAVLFEIFKRNKAMEKDYAECVYDFMSCKINELVVELKFRLRGGEEQVEISPRLCKLASEIYTILTD